MNEEVKITTSGPRYKALDVLARTDEEVVLAVRPDCIVVALNAKQARAAYDKGLLTGWTPMLDPAPDPPAEHPSCPKCGAPMTLSVAWKLCKVCGYREDKSPEHRGGASLRLKMKYGLNG